MAAEKQTRLLFWFSLCLLIALLAGCDQATPTVPAAVESATHAIFAPTNTPVPQSSTVEPTPTAAVTASRTPTPEGSPAPGADSKAQLRATITSTPPATQQVTWNQAVATPRMLNLFDAVWSPVENRLVGIRSVDAEGGNIGLASAPDFELTSVKIDQTTFSGTSFIWTPDGRRIVFVGPFRLILGERPVDEQGGELWTMGRDGDTPQALFVEAGYSSRFPEFSGWLDPTTLVFTEYEGGGSSSLTIVDTHLAELLTGMMYHGLAFPPNSRFIPVTSWFWSLHRLSVLSKFPKEIPVSTELIPGVNEHVIEFNRDAWPENTGFYFRGWEPGSDRMLVLAYEVDQDFQITSSDLLLWNVSSGTHRALIEGGLDGCFSPDGQLLAAVIAGEPKVGNGILSFDPVPNGPPHLVLIHVESRRVLFSGPVYTDIGSGISSDGFIFETPLAFSPSGRYLAFTVRDESQVQTDEGPLSLTVLDLETKETLTGFPAHQYPELTWSPASRYLVYQSPDGNWNLLDMKKMTSVALTEYAGSVVESPQWSFDGRYLSFTIWKYPLYEMPPQSQTAIFTLP